MLEVNVHRRDGKQGRDHWQYDFRVTLPDGSIYRERRKARGATSESAARRIGETRMREVLRSGPPGKKAMPIAELPTLDLAVSWYGEPGRTPVILAPQAVADLLEFFIDSLDARQADEGRSAFSRPGGGTRVGERMFHAGVKLWSDPSDKADPAEPFDGEGRPHRKVTWVEGGELRALHTSRYWAEHQGLPDLPSPSSLHMDGGTDELEALIAGFDRGVLISRFWYSRMLEPQRLLVTGLTRDGTFFIEKGKIVEPLRNFRWNDSPLSVLAKVVALGKPQRAGLSRGPDGWGALREDVERLLCALSVPQLVLHTRILERALRESGARLYLKIGTTGTGGMGLNIPYTHGEERPTLTGSGSELDGVRPWRRGDTMRQVVWKKVARSNELVSRETDASDSRAVRVSITDTGRAVFADLWPHMHEAQERMFRGIPDAERRAFTATLQKMLTNIRKHEI